MLTSAASAGSASRACNGAYGRPSRLVAHAPIEDWRATHALIERIPDFYSREALQFALVSLYTLRDLPKMSKHEVANRKRELQSIAAIFMADSAFREHFVGAGFLELVNHHAHVRFSQSDDLERDFNFLKDVGMDRFLITIPYLERKASLRWWLEKEALPSFDVGLGDGKTARELNLRWIKHGTKTELIDTIVPRRAIGAKPNLLMSRPGIIDEAADFGAGHYCVREEIAIPVPHDAVIRYELNPGARAGTDFKIVFDERDLLSYIVVLNRAALKINGYDIR